MSNIHTVSWNDTKILSPQAACAVAMREKRPFVLGLTFYADPGDLLLFPAFFVSYPVLRYAKKSEIRARGFDINVVCQEPPDESTETVTEGADAGETVGSGGGRQDKWGYER